MGYTKAKERLWFMEGIEVPKIYLETTMFSFYYEEREYGEYPKYKAQARQIFDRIKAGGYEPYASTLATDEIDNEKNQEKRENMWRLVLDYGIRILPADDDEVKRLAGLYIQEGAVSPGKCPGRLSGHRHIQTCGGVRIMKTVQEYMNDPRIMNDPDMAGALEPVREIHAIRLKIQDEKARIGEEEYNKRIKAVLARRGISICRDLVGQGKLKPRQLTAR